MPITDSQLDNWFTYHSPKPNQPASYEAIREAGKLLPFVRSGKPS